MCLLFPPLQIFQHKNFQVELINKQHDQMYALLAIALTLHPTRIDESVHSQLKVIACVFCTHVHVSVNVYCLRFLYACKLALS